jgi:prohibitin 2
MRKISTLGKLTRAFSACR